LFIVTDHSITPPEGWRYIIWDGTETDDAVASIVPLDPETWGIDDKNRMATIKHRIRTACLSSIGQFLGLATCRTPTCFLKKPVDSVTDLDVMRSLGPEHTSEAPGLTGWGFDLPGKDTTEVQEPRQIKEEPYRRWPL
jgi:hypothetical protein